MKIIICKGCMSEMQARNIKTGNPVCTTCIGLEKESGIPIEINTYDEHITCTDCNKKWKGKDVPPFFKFHPIEKWKKEYRQLYYDTLRKFWKYGGSGDTCPNAMTKILKEKLKLIKKQGNSSCTENSYYCGCHGWD